MSIDHRLRTALLWLTAVLVVSISGHYYVLPYAAALGLMLMVLGLAPRYRQSPQRQRYDAVFIGYLWVVVAVRCRPFRCGPVFEEGLNMLEHLGFALVIGLMSYLVFRLLLRWSTKHALIAAVIGFNLLGFGNELFQNAMNGRALWPLTGDAWKDVAMNALGSVVLMVVMARETRR